MADRLHVVRLMVSAYQHAEGAQGPVAAMSAALGVAERAGWRPPDPSGAAPAMPKPKPPRPQSELVHEGFFPKRATR